MSTLVGLKNADPTIMGVSQSRGIQRLKEGLTPYLKPYGMTSTVGRVSRSQPSSLTREKDVKAPEGWDDPFSVIVEFADKDKAKEVHRVLQDDKQELKGYVVYAISGRTDI